MKSLAARLDGFVNLMSGLGTSRDRTVYGDFCADAFLDEPLLTSLFNSNYIARKAVTTKPAEAFRKGYLLLGKDGPRLTTEGAALSIDARMHDAALWAGLYGGAVIWAVTDDAAPVEAPRPRGAPGNVIALEVYDKRRVQVESYYPDTGRPSRYRITPVIGYATVGPIVVHESRLVRFGGAKTDDDTRRALAGWDCSVLQAVYPALLAYMNADGAAGVMLSEGSQGIFKLSGLLEAITSGRTQELQARLSLMDTARSIVKAIMLDADPENGESFERSSVAFGGVSDVVKTKMQAIASAAELPMSLLFSQGPGGLNASDDNELIAFYDRTAAFQSHSLTPRLLRLLHMIDPRASLPVVKWHPLLALSQKDEAAARASQATADAAYVAMGAVTPEEIARSRFGQPTGYSHETKIDLANRPEVSFAPVAPPPALPPSPVAPAPTGPRPPAALGPGPSVR